MGKQWLGCQAMSGPGWDDLWAHALDELCHSRPVPSLYASIIVHPGRKLDVLGAAVLDDARGRIEIARLRPRTRLVLVLVLGRLLCSPRRRARVHACG